MMLASRVFVDRASAGVALARKLLKQHFQPPVLVLGLPRGGVPVAYEVARLMNAPLDVMLVRKVAMPRQPELAIGAVALGNITVHESQMAAQIPDFHQTFERLAQEQRHELEHREKLYRVGRPPLELRGKTVILVDDGLATGSTMLAAVRAVRKAGATTVAVAVPVASAEAARLVAAEAEHVVILEVPRQMFAIGSWYEHFEQLEDRTVCDLLAHGRRQPVN